MLSTVTQGRIAKLIDGKFVVQGLAADGGEFELEADENEWTLTTGDSDFNGEFAAIIPSSAVKAAAGGKAAGEEAAAGGKAAGGKAAVGKAKAAKKATAEKKVTAEKKAADHM